jgi:hypothetical protein
MTQDLGKGGPGQKYTSYTGMGISIGAGVGVALGLAFSSLALGIAIGVSLGLAVGAILDRRNADAVPQGDGGSTPPGERDPRWLRWLAAFGLLLFLAVATMTILLLLRSGQAMPLHELAG